MKMFNRKVFGENKAFKSLAPHMVKRLGEIFKDIDLDDKGSIDVEKARNYNAWVYYSKKITHLDAEKDAMDFLNECCTIEKKKDKLYLEEWLYRFAILYTVEGGKEIYKQFLDDYDAAVEDRGTCRSCYNNDV